MAYPDPRASPQIARPTPPGQALIRERPGNMLAEGFYKVFEEIGLESALHFKDLVQSTRRVLKHLKLTDLNNIPKPCPW
jgi:hypothetical protein